MIEIHNKRLCESCFSEVESDVCPNCGFSKAGSAGDPLALPIGTDLNDKVRIGRIMGKGGFGITYMAYDLRMDKVIAVKEYYPNGIAYRSPANTQVLIGDTKSAEAFEKGAEKFYSEAEMVAQFNGNPNIVSVYDYFRANNTVYLIMEYLNGITLKKYIKEHGKLSDGQAMFIMNKIAAALSITHSAGVLHRDISPDNIMLCTDGKVKLIDFGAARQIMAESSANLTVVLKPGYTPIEQYTKKGQQGAWTDIYALGVSVYYALTEIVIDDPYARMDDDEEFAENKHGINTGLWEILKKCTMINASDRYNNALELRKALSSVSDVKPEPIALEDSDVKQAPAAAPAASAMDATVALDETSAMDATVALEESPEDETAAIEDTSSMDVTVALDEAAAAAMEEAKLPKKAEAPKKEKPKKEAAPKKEKPKKEAAPKKEKPRKEAAPKKEKPKKEKAPEKEKGSGKSSGRKKTLIGVICAAAAVLVGVIMVVVSLNSGKAPEEGNYLLIDKSDILWSMEKKISADTLRELNSDILVTLNVNINFIAVNEDGELYHSIAVRDNNGHALAIDAYNAFGDGSGYYFLADNQKQFTFLLPKNSIPKKGGYMRFDNEGLIVDSAELRTFSSSGTISKTVNFDGKYPDDWVFMNGGIPKKDLEGFGRDVMVTLYIETGVYGDGSNLNSHINFWNENWNIVDVSVFNRANPTPEMNMYDVYDGQRKFVFVISRERIEALPDEGLKIQVHNVIVKSAKLEACTIGIETDASSADAEGEEAAEDTEAAAAVIKTSASAAETTAAVTETAEARVTETAAANEEPIDYLFIDDDYYSWSMRKLILIDDLKKFKEDVLVTLNITTMNLVKTGGEGHSTYNHTIQVLNSDNMVSTTSFNMEDYDGTYVIEDDLEQFMFIISESTISDMSGSINFRSEGLLINSVELRPYKGLSSDVKTVQIGGEYPGDFEIQGTISKKDLESFGGDVLVSLELEHYGYQGWDNISIVRDVTNFTLADITAFNHPTRYPPDEMYPLYAHIGQKEFIFVISREEIENLSEDGLYLQVYNVIVRSADLSAYEPIV